MLIFGPSLYHSHMTLQQFRDSLTAAEPPRDLGLALSALWWDANNNWKRAHEEAQHPRGGR